MDCIAIICSVLTGQALKVFNASILSSKNSEQDLVDNDMYAGLNAVAETVFPQNAITQQKRYMRRAMSMPTNMKTFQFVAQLKELLKSAGKPVSGKKADLISRLME